MSYQYIVLDTCQIWKSCSNFNQIKSVKIVCCIFNGTQCITRPSIFYQIWKDKHISWNPKDFGYIDRIRIPIDKIWRPDLELYNAREAGRRRFGPSVAVISSDGTVLYTSPGVLTTNCKIDLTYFPHDTQGCNIKFVLWSYTGYEVGIELYEHRYELDLDDYTPNQNFMLHKTRFKSYWVPYNRKFDEIYPEFTFSLHLTRRGGLLSLVYIAPIFVLAIVCPLVFLLPSAKGQRFSLGEIRFFSILMTQLPVGDYPCLLCNVRSY